MLQTRQLGLTNNYLFFVANDKIHPNGKKGPDHLNEWSDLLLSELIDLATGRPIQMIHMIHLNSFNKCWKLNPKMILLRSFSLFLIQSLILLTYIRSKLCVTWAYPGESKGCFTGHFRPFRGHLNSASIWKLRLDPNNNGRPCQIGSSPSIANIRNQTCEIQLRFAN